MQDRKDPIPQASRRGRLGCKAQSRHPPSIAPATIKLDPANSQVARIVSSYVRHH
jgi:hypothetical protein